MCSCVSYRKVARRSMLADLGRGARVLRMMVECRMEGRIVFEVGELESSILDRKDLCQSVVMDV